MLSPIPNLHLYPHGRAEVDLVQQALGDELVLSTGLPSATHVALISQSPGIVPLVEATQRLRARLSASQELWVVAPLILALGESAALLRVGAQRALTPRSTRPEDLAARILAEVYLRQGSSPHAVGLLGNTPAMRRVRADIVRFAPYAEPVLVQGETGTGKELVAEALHRLSGRRGPLISENCGAIAANLAESLLFGHVKGAFTGATADRDGLLLEARDGTLFLDELGELPADQQVKLLRVLETRRVRPVGGREDRAMTARVVLATNRDLLQDVRDGRMREDLYYRLSTLTITLPPLRDRSADIPLLAEHFLELFNQTQRRRQRLPVGGDCLLIRRQWPGNVRELRNVISRAAIFTDGDDGELPSSELADERFSGSNASARGVHIRFDPSADRWEDLELRARKAYLESLLSTCGGDRKRAVTRSGLGRSTFFRWLRELGLGAAEDD